MENVFLMQANQAERVCSKTVSSFWKPEVKIAPRCLSLFLGRKCEVAERIFESCVLFSEFTQVKQKDFILIDQKLKSLQQRSLAALTDKRPSAYG